MPANVGRLLVISKNAVAIAGVRTKTITAGADPIDITTDDEDGYRTLLAEEGQRQLDMTVEGVLKDDVLRQILLNDGAAMLTDIEIAFPNGDTITGSFFLSSYEESGSYNDAITFTSSLQSSGQWTFTELP